MLFTYRFDVSTLSSIEKEQFENEAKHFAFMVTVGEVSEKGAMYYDVFFEHENDIPLFLNKYKSLKYIDYSHIPYEYWKYPF